MTQADAGPPLARTPATPSPGRGQTPDSGQVPGSGSSRLALERAAYRAAQRRRSGAIAGTSSAVLALVVVLAVLSSPGWPAVRDTFADLGVARASVGPVLQGLWLNIRLLVVCEVLVLLLGLGIAVLRTSRSPVLFPVRFLAAAYTDVFRGVPLIILLLLIGLGLPGLEMAGVPTEPAVLGAAAIVITYAAYVAEVFRAGIESVHPSQRAAARSLGLTHAQTMRRVVLPQAVRRVVPPLLNDFVALQKDVGLVSILGAVDAVQAARIIQAETYNFTPYLVAGLAFVVLAIPTARIADNYTLRSFRRQSGSVVA